MRAHTSDMNTPEMEALRAFRNRVYRSFGCRRDALFELMDAVVMPNCRRLS
jgi:hypothetical protein